MTQGLVLLAAWAQVAVLVTLLIACLRRSSRRIVGRCKHVRWRSHSSPCLRSPAASVRRAAWTLPVLVIANDPDYMGENSNGRVTNFLGVTYLVIVLVASIGAIPLMFATKAGL